MLAICRSPSDDVEFFPYRTLMLNAIHIKIKFFSCEVVSSYGSSCSSHLTPGLWSQLAGDSFLLQDSATQCLVAGKQAGDVARVLVEECHLPVSPKYSSISICQVLSSYFNTKIQLPSSFAPVPTSPLFNFFAVSFHVAIVVVVPHQFQFSFNLSLCSELVAELDAHLPSLLPTCKSKPGASELVAHLKANRVPLAIATSSR